MPYGKESKQRLAVDRDKVTGRPANCHEASREEEESHRPAFAHDSDRLIDTAGFRRLQGKMQVVSPGQGDFFRTRLTHTIEVSRLARSIAYRVGRETNKKHALQTALICEAAGIAHDFGHPPFGHGGERALNTALEEIARDWGIDIYSFGGFEGNAQTFRQIVWSFSRSSSEPGLHLTRAVLDAVLKYPWKKAPFDMPKPNKWGYYPTEQWAFDWVRKGVTAERFTDQSYEAQIMDWADDVAYATHDLEDWFRAGLIPLNLLSKSPSARHELAENLAKGSTDPAGESVKYEARLRFMFKDSEFFDDFVALEGEYDGSTVAKNAVRSARRRLFRYFINKPTAKGDISSGRHEAQFVVSPEEIRDVSNMIHKMTDFYVLKSPSMATYEYGQSRIVDFLMKTYASLVKADDRSTMNAIPAAERDIIYKLRNTGDRATSQGEILRVISDYVAGMTDAYAGMMYSRLNGEENATYHMYF